jgi:hypothetical protein
LLTLSANPNGGAANFFSVSNRKHPKQSKASQEIESIPSNRKHPKQSKASEAIQTSQPAHIYAGYVRAAKTVGCVVAS